MKASFNRNLTVTSVETETSWHIVQRVEGYITVTVFVNQPERVVDEQNDSNGPAPENHEPLGGGAGDGAVRVWGEARHFPFRKRIY